MPSSRPAIGVLLHEKGDDGSTILASFALGLRAGGANIGGLVQRTSHSGEGKRAILLRDIRTGASFRISQDLGPLSTSCSLDPQGLAEASAVLRREMEAGVDLLVINQFGEMEAAGGGLIAETFEAASRSIPVLTSLATCHRPAWDAATEGAGEMLDSSPEALSAWWTRLRTR